MWNAERRQLLEDLNTIDTALGCTYSKAVELIGSYSPTADSARIDASLVGHTVRELINTLPHCISGPSLPPSAKDEENHACDKLIREIESCGLAYFEVDAGDEMVEVPTSLLVSLSDYYRARKKGSLSSRQKDSVTVFGDVRPDDGVLGPWRRSGDFFKGITHLAGLIKTTPPSREEMEFHLSIIERMLMTRFGRFFAAKERLLALVSQANSRNSDGLFVVPSDKDVLGALSSINNDVLRHLFYSKLINPEWLLPLDKAKAFDGSIRVDANGTEVPWAESSYLINMASKRPEDVVRILVKAARCAGLYCRVSMLEVAVRVSAEHAVKFVPYLIEWASDSDSPQWLWGNDDVLPTIVKLLVCDETHEQGIKLACALFLPRTGLDNGYYADVRTAIPIHRYAEMLRAVVEVLPANERVQISKNLLGSYFKAKNHDGSSLKNSDWYIPSIAGAVRGRDDEPSISIALVRMLVSALRDCAKDDVAQFEAAFHDKRPIVKRAALYVLSEGIKDSHALSEKLHHYVDAVISSGLLFDSEYDAESAEFIRVLVEYDVPEYSEAVVGLVSSPPESLLARFRQLSARMYEAEEDVEREVSRRLRLWQHMRISLLRDLRLTDAAAKLLRDLDEEFGNRDYSFEKYTSRTITGPNSPLQLEDMKALSAPALLQHLKNWQPSREERWELVEHAGQARVLRELVKTSPRFFDGMTDALKELRPIYCEAIIDGLADALEEGEAISIPDFVGLCVWASGLDESASFEEGDEDEGASYRNLVFASVNNVHRLLRAENARNVFSECPEELLKVLKNGLASKEPDEEYEKKYGGNNTDPVNMAANTIRPCSIEGIARWASHFEDSPIACAALDSLLGVAPHVSISEADAAAFGLAVPLLVGPHSNWAVQHRSDFFGESAPNDYQQIALATILNFYNVSPTMLEYLRCAFISAIEADCVHCMVGPRAIAQTTEWNIGSWLYLAYVYGYIGIDDELVLLWESSVEGVVAW